MGKRQEQGIREFIETLALEFNGRPMIIVNADKSIDAEILFRLRDEETVRDRIFEIEDFVREHRLRARLPEKSFISVGLRWEPKQRTIRGRKGPKADSPEFDKISGLRQLFTSFYGKRSLPVADSAGIIIADKLTEGKWAKNFEQILYRIHWNPAGKQPPRPRKRK